MAFTYLPIPGSPHLKSFLADITWWRTHCVFNFAVAFRGQLKNGGNVPLEKQYLAGFKFRLARPSWLVGSFLTRGEAPFGSSIKNEGNINWLVVIGKIKCSKVCGCALQTKRPINNNLK